MILEHFQNLCIVTFVENSSTTTAVALEEIVSGSAAIAFRSAVTKNTSMVVSSSAAEAGKPSGYVTSHLGQLSLLPSVGW